MKLRRTTPEISVNPLRLYQRQVEALFDGAQKVALFSFIGALISLAVIYRDGANGDNTRLFLWFGFATAVTLFRSTVVSNFKRKPDLLHKAHLWVRLAVVGNFFAGVQWGLLGTVLFDSVGAYGQLFILMVIICYVAGSIIPYAPVRWAHPALLIPATMPTIVYVFFFHTTPQWLAGVMALFFIFTTMYFSLQQHLAVVSRLTLELQNEALVEELNLYNHELGAQNNQLKYRSAVVKRAELDQRRRNGILATHVERTLMPVIECDRQFGIVTWNDAAASLLGYRIDEVSGKSLVKLFFPPERHGNIDTFLERLFAEERATIIDMAVLTRNQQRIPVRLYVTPILAEDRSPIQIAIIIAESYAESRPRGYAAAYGLKSGARKE